MVSCGHGMTPCLISSPLIALPAGGEDLFVHQTAIITDGFRSLKEGEPVEFFVENSDDGRAKAVQVTGPDGAAPEVRWPDWSSHEWWALERIPETSPASLFICSREAAS